jgi:hypothetical protein
MKNSINLEFNAAVQRQHVIGVFDRLFGGSFFNAVSTCCHGRRLWMRDL